MNGSRGAKGSINDRLISMMYRNRYMKLKLKKEQYTKDKLIKELEYLKKMQYFDINHGTYTLDYHDELFIQNTLNNISVKAYGISKNDSIMDEVNEKTSASADDNFATLHDLSDTVANIEPYDIEFDVVSAIDSKASKSTIDQKQTIRKVNDEIVIIDEISKFVKNSSEIIFDISNCLNILLQEIPDNLTNEELQEVKLRIDKVNHLIFELKEQYNIMSTKYDFEDYGILNNIKLLDAIENYKSLASIDELETIVLATKEELTELSSIEIIDEENKILLSNYYNHEEQVQKDNQRLANDKSKVNGINELEQLITREAREQQYILERINKSLYEFDTEIVKTTYRINHTQNLFGSFLRIAAGILTAPFSDKQILGVMLGTHLIDNGLRDLRESITPEYKEQIEEKRKYRDLEKEIFDSKNYIRGTNLLLADSLEQLSLLEEEFKYRFKNYVNTVPEYKETIAKINELKIKLTVKKMQLEVMDRDLDRQHEINKEKTKR